ncbi:MAG TPA: rod shape-determining protein MreD [Stellaceae bacterium]|nr:rod shape-determining protein MreD [Stellaceae bacterium]
MKAITVDRIDGFGVRLVPVLLTLLVVVVSIVPLGIPGYAAVTPVFTLMAVYHWTIYRPELMPPVALFAIGLLQDLLTSGPIGLSPLLLLVIRALVMSQRRFFVGKLFPFVWWGFAATVVAASLMLWVAAGALSGRLLDPRSFAFQAVLTVACYPAASWVFVRVYRFMLARG